MSVLLTAGCPQELSVPHHIRQAEISDLQVVVLVKQQILRLEIAVNSQSGSSLVIVIIIIQVDRW